MDFEPTNVNTVEENASDYLSKVNILLAQNGVVDKEGNPAKLVALAGSPTWLFALAQGQNTTEWQERLRKAYYSIDIENCDDEQVYVLATLAGVLFKEQSSPMISLLVKNTEDSPITLNASSCYAEDSFGKNKWYPGNAYTIASQEETRILFYCSDKAGSTPPNTVFTIKSTQTPSAFAPISIVTNESSSILFQGETAADLRNRVLLGSYAMDQISQAETAIQNLNGIIKCSIYFNPDANLPLPLPGSITLPPRTSFISIQGVDTDNLLATTYFKYMNVQSLELESSLRSETNVGASQLFAYYSPAVEVKPYVKIILDPTDASITTYPDYIKQILMEHKYDIAIGAPITAQKISAWIDQGNKYGVIIDTKLSSDGTNWYDTFSPSVFQVPVLDEDYIIFEEVSLQGE